jgi:hypothetical protein
MTIKQGKHCLVMLSDLEQWLWKLCKHLELAIS